MKPPCYSRFDRSLRRMTSVGNGPNRSFWSPSNCQAGLLRGGLLANRCRMKFTYLYRYRLAEIPTMDEKSEVRTFLCSHNPSSTKASSIGLRLGRALLSSARSIERSSRRSLSCKDRHHRHEGIAARNLNNSGSSKELRHRHTRTNRVSSRDCVKKARKRHAVRKMKVGPSEPPCRRRLQTAISCFGPKGRGGERYG